MRLQDYIKPNEKGEIPLNQAILVGQLKQVVEDLKASGEKLSLDHFLIKDKDGWTPLHWATFIGDLNQAIKTLETSGEKFTTKHFLIQDDQGRTPLSLAAKYFHLDQIFVPSYWKGRVGEMIDLWKEASPQSNENLNFEALRDEAIQLTMQSLPKIDLQTLNQAVRPTVSLSTSEKEMTESRKLTDLSK